MDSSFVVIRSIPKETNTQILKRIEIINSICNETERGHLTEYSHIWKLCRACATDILKTLTNYINWETTRYKKYKENLEISPNDLIEELKVNISDSEFLYNKYLSLYKKLQKIKLYTKCCYICEEISFHN